uniref:Uncharacterized protein n=1 Tax=Theropithecus gelada TaxID=9565 RepID=A0A8D2GBQ4_THEGE
MVGHSLGFVESLRTSHLRVDVSLSRVLRERKEGNKRQEGRPEDVYSPPGQALQKGEGAQSTEDKTKEAGEDKAAEQGPSLSKAELHKDAKGKAGPGKRSIFPPRVKIKYTLPWSGHVVLGNHMLSGSSAGTAGLPQRGPFQHFMNKKVEKRLASWKERCSLYGDVDMHKYDQSGQVFTPFQVLTTTDMQRLVLPQDLPTSHHIQRMDASCLTDANLQDLPLSSTELEKPVSHIKTPLFPATVKATKSNDMK